MLKIVLFQPEIPPNTGNIIRLCANTGAALHLIEPLGFDWDDRKLRRAGLDYHEYAAVTRHATLGEYLRDQNPARVFAFSTKGRTLHTNPAYEADDTLLFGPETRGLPDEVLALFPREQLLRIPMQPHSRSLNLANAVSVGLFEAWRQLGFAVSAP